MALAVAKRVMRRLDDKAVASVRSKAATGFHERPSIIKAAPSGPFQSSFVPTCESGSCRLSLWARTNKSFRSSAVESYSDWLCQENLVHVHYTYSRVLWSVYTDYFVGIVVCKALCFSLSHRCSSIQAANVAVLTSFISTGSREIINEQCIFYLLIKRGPK